MIVVDLGRYSDLSNLLVMLECIFADIDGFRPPHSDVFSTQVIDVVMFDHQ